jgi:hypothetical protein
MEILIILYVIGFAIFAIIAANISGQVYSDYKKDPGRFGNPSPFQAITILVIISTSLTVLWPISLLAILSPSKNVKKPVPSK